MSGDDPGAAGGFVVSFAAGSRIAGYRLEERIGKGGMAVVFRARDEGLGRLVALKILAQTLAGDTAFQRRSSVSRERRRPSMIRTSSRFSRRARRKACSSSPCGTWQAGMPLAAEPGGTVAAGRVAAIISPVASALDAAHGDGLLHRDVKTSNMLMDVLTGRPDHVYLSDFGLSKAVETTSGMTKGRRGHGDAGLHGPRADSGPAGRRPDRSVRAGLLGLRVADRDAAVPPRRAHGRDVRPPVGIPAAADVPPAGPSSGGRRRPVDRRWPRHRATGTPAAGSSPTRCATRSASRPTIPVPAVMAEATHPPTEIARRP